MKKINFKILIITSIVCLLPIILGLVFYTKLPESIAIHFDINGNPDNYFSKPLFIFGMPCIMVLFQVFCCVISDIKDENPEANKKVVGVYKWIIPVITILMYVVTLLYALGSAIDIRKIVMIILGVLFIITGNYVPKTVGHGLANFPRVKDEKVDIKIKRLVGYIMIVNGLLAITSILFSPLVSVAGIVLMILEAITLGVYALVKFEK